MNALLSIALLAASPLPSAQAQTADPFSVAKDLCARWTIEGRLQGVVRQRFTSWLEGVLTGYAVAAHKSPPTAESTLKVRDWMDKFCASHPSATMNDAASALLEARPGR